MNDTMKRHPLALKRIVYRVDGMEAVPVTQDAEFSSSTSGPLKMDIYRPPDSPSTRVPAVILVTGYADVGVAHPLGCAFKEMACAVSLAQAIAASGMAAVAYPSKTPVEDGYAVVEHLAREGSVLGVDGSRMALWGSSGHVPTALRLLASNISSIKAAVLSNGFMFDVDGAPVAKAARQYGFAHPPVAVEDLPADVPLFVVRSGRDEFEGVNASIDRFLMDALRRNLPVTFVNHAGAQHAFEINDDSPVSRHVIGQMLGFLRLHLEA